MLAISIAHGKLIVGRRAFGLDSPKFIITRSDPGEGPVEHGEKVTFADKQCMIGAYLLWNTIRNSYGPSPMAMTSLRSDVIVMLQCENSILTSKRCELLWKSIRNSELIGFTFQSSK
jgi:hypothetical protein